MVGAVNKSTFQMNSPTVVPAVAYNMSRGDVSSTHVREDTL